MIMIRDPYNVADITLEANDSAAETVDANGAFELDMLQMVLRLEKVVQMVTTNRNNDVYISAAYC